MELRQLEIFRILAKELNFTRAAERAHCVQSNVSVQMRRLEGELGVQLFERLGAKVRLTPHGATLLPYAERVLQTLKEAQHATTSGGMPIGKLTVGAPESVLTYRLPGVIRSFRDKFPSVELVFRGLGSREVGTELENGEIDVGLVIDDTLANPQLYVESLRSESVVLLVQPGHALLKSSARISPEALSAQPFLLTDVGCAYRNKLERALARANVRPEAITEFGSVETIKRYASLGMGIACLPEIIAHQELVSGKLIVLPWKGPELGMHTLMAWHSDKWLSPAMQSFVSLLRATLRDHEPRTRSKRARKLR